MTARGVVRRARPGLGTLVELGALVEPGPAGSARAAAALEAGFRALEAVERALSAFDPASDVARFNAAPAGARLAVGPETAAALGLADALARESGGLFDATQGTGPASWALEAGGVLAKLAPGVRLDLGGIGKGYAVDRAFEAVAAALDGGGGTGACWVNAGGDLRVRGVELPVHLRDERHGGARPWLALSDGALATSLFGPGARARLAGAPSGLARHVSVAAGTCAVCDALTKIVALSGRADHPLLARHGAVAWVHPDTSPEWRA